MHHHVDIQQREQEQCSKYILKMLPNVSSILGLHVGFSGVVVVNYPHRTKSRKEYFVFIGGPPSLSTAVLETKVEEVAKTPKCGIKIECLHWAVHLPAGDHFP